MSFVVEHRRSDAYTEATEVLQQGQVRGEYASEQAATETLEQALDRLRRERGLVVAWPVRCPDNRSVSARGTT
jgi:hypothetical protein